VSRRCKTWAIAGLRRKSREFLQRRALASWHKISTAPGGARERCDSQPRQELRFRELLPASGRMGCPHRHRRQEFRECLPSPLLGGVFLRACRCRCRMRLGIRSGRGPMVPLQRESASRESSCLHRQTISGGPPCQGVGASITSVPPVDSLSNPRFCDSGVCPPTRAPLSFRRNQAGNDSRSSCTRTALYVDDVVGGIPPLVDRTECRKNSAYFAVAGTVIFTSAMQVRYSKNVCPQDQRRCPACAVRL
jgi:hypothetical protein